MSRYVAKPEPENINAPASRPLRDFALLFVGALVVLVALCSLVGWFGESLLLQSSPSTEAAILSRVMKPKVRLIRKVPELAEMSRVAPSRNPPQNARL